VIVDTTKYEPHFYGPVQGVVIGEGNTVTLIFQSGEQHTTPFLAPPRPPYDLVGRDDLLRDLKQRLFAGGNLALSALNGLPGVGKTALAVELTHDPEVLGHFQDGVLWAGLGRGPDVLALLGIWAMALGFTSDEIAKRTTIEDRRALLSAAIGQRRMLLVADDAWQPEAALAFQVGGVNCAHLVTTRQPSIALDFAGEGLTVTELSGEAGLALLKALAPAAAAAEPKAAQEMVEAVGGLPLALILIGRYLRKEAHSGQPRRLRTALARLREVEERLQLEQPQAPPGHYPALPADVPLSLVAAIAISDDALDEAARRTFYALSVFPPKPNTFSEEAAMAVAAEPLNALETLTDYGLLESSGPGRYTLHQVIADYAGLKRIDETAYERMVAFFVNYVEAHETDYDALEQEVNNILASLQSAFDHGMQTALVQGANGFYHFLDARGLYALADVHLSRAERIARLLNDTTHLATTLFHLGEMAYSQGDAARAEEFYQEGLSLAREIGCSDVISDLLQGLGALANKQGEYTSAEEYWMEGLALARAIGQPGRIAAMLQGFGTMMFYRGEYERATELYQEALTLAHQSESSIRTVGLLANLGTLALNCGDYSQAEQYYQDGLRLAQKIGHREKTCALLQGIGAVAHGRGDCMKAKEYYQKGLDLAREIGHHERICTLLANLSSVMIIIGNDVLAEEYLLEGLALARKIGHRERVSQLLNNLGSLAMKHGDYALAEALYQEGLTLARTIGHQEAIITLLRGLGNLAFSRNDYIRAEKYYGEGLDVAREIGHQWLISGILANQGELHLEQHNWDLAAAAFRKALGIAQEVGFQEYVAKALYGLARVAFDQGYIAEAQRQGRESLTILAAMGHEDTAEVKEWLDGLLAVDSSE
jgi:tetratricopeptide (TPR) repeat protein